MSSGGWVAKPLLGNGVSGLSIGMRCDPCHVVRPLPCVFVKGVCGATLTHWKRVRLVMTLALVLSFPAAACGATQSSGKGGRAAKY